MAVETFQEALQWATTPSGQQLPVAARAYNGLSRIFYEWNELEAVAQYTRQCIELGQRWGNINALTTAQLTLARVQEAQGDLTGAQTFLDEAAKLAQEHILAPGGAGNVETSQIRLWLAAGNLEAAARWVQKNGFKVDHAVPPLRGLEYRFFARVLLARNEIDPALEVINRLLGMAETNGQTGAVIEILTLKALALQMKKDTPQALQSLGRALVLAQPEGYLRTFLDEGAPMVMLLRLAGSQGIEPRYVSRLLAEFDRLPESTPTLQQPLIEPLSERELEVLRLAAAGHSNREIAAQLVLSTGTVKSHLSHIFGKLNVDSRTQCIARARELQLLS
jgi:LuxR family maltose regulon positive regulatory protein